MSDKDTLLLFREKGSDKWELYYMDGKPQSRRTCEWSAMTTVKHRDADWLFVDIKKAIPWDGFNMKART